jgi:hypothetical protein
MGNSAIGRGTAVEEQKVKASSGDSSPGFLDAKVGAGMSVVANQLVSEVTEIHADSFTRDTSVGTGDVPYTGVGFQPKAVIFFHTLPGTFTSSWGFISASSGVAAGYCISSDSGTVLASRNAGIFADVVHISDYNDITNATFDSDGFTLSWRKVGSPTGTINVRFLAIR